MLISPFTPLCFSTHRTDGIPSEYMQVFAPTDHILIEVFVEKDTDMEWVLYSEPGHIEKYTIAPQRWNINEATDLLFFSLSPEVGIYSLEIGGMRSNIFRVTDNERILSGTTLIQYSNRNNRQRCDVVFYIERMQYFFDFRVPGGFRDCDWVFTVDSEQFVTPTSDINQLYNRETLQKRFTLGTSAGVPVWFGDMLNRLLTCSHVYFDGVKYSRVEANVPEMNVQLEGVNSFVFTQLLQQSVNLDPDTEAYNMTIIRRVEDELYRNERII